MIPPRVLFVASSSPPDARGALLPEPEGSAGWRLRQILGLSNSDYLALERTHLCPRGQWNVQFARTRAEALSCHGTPFRVIVTIGDKVRRAFARALSQRFSEWDVWRDHRPICESSQHPLTVVCLPPIGGPCQIWAFREAVELARETMRGVAPHIPWGAEAARLEAIENLFKVPRSS